MEVIYIWNMASSEENMDFQLLSENFGNNNVHTLKKSRRNVLKPGNDLNFWY